MARNDRDDGSPSELETNHYEVRQFYFGRFADLDPIESGWSDHNYENEHWEVEGWKEGQEYTKDDGLRIVDIIQNDTVRIGGWYGTNGGNRLEENDYKNRYEDGEDRRVGADSFTYDLGDGITTSDIDSVFDWVVEVTAADGSTYTTLMYFIQLENGDIFSNTNAGTWNHDVGSTIEVKSIKLVESGRSDYYGTAHQGSLPDDVVICFEESAAILTPDGPVAAGDLKVGDAVITKDRGIRHIRWINRRHLGAEALRRNPALLPIRIAAGSLGRKLPQRDLLVSPQHRMLVESRISARLFDEGVLVAAKHLLELPGITVEDTDHVTYVHFAFDQHEIVFAEGAPAESFYPGRMALAGMTPEAREELLTLFPELESGLEALPGARRFLSGREGRNLARRHRKNNLALVTPYPTAEAGAALPNMPTAGGGGRRSAS